MEQVYTPAALEALSYALPISETAKDLLKEMDGKISEKVGFFKSKKLNHLLPPVLVQKKRYYKSWPTINLLWF